MQGNLNLVIKYYCEVSELQSHILLKNCCNIVYPDTTKVIFFLTNN